MTKEILYTYLGTNGTITTPVHLEGVPCIKRYHLKADKNKVLTNGIVKSTTVTVAAEDIDKWSEVNP
ncbi:MAG: hypothetical protein J6T34_00630 [Bacilli bacterium]|nr:hypothetical protein [Bacilli bacterium]